VVAVVDLPPWPQGRGLEVVVVACWKTPRLAFCFRLHTRFLSVPVVLPQPSETQLSLDRWLRWVAGKHLTLAEQHRFLEQQEAAVTRRPDGRR